MKNTFKPMFYKKGVDIASDKSMFEFLKNHPTYHTLNSWNKSTSIAHNVKVYNLGLEGDCYIALDLLNNDNYETVNWTIREFEAEHDGYEVGFNGRSSGYLVLCNKDNYCSVLPRHIAEAKDYQAYKNYCQAYCGSVKENREELVELVRLVQDFDKLCDEIRHYANRLSKLTPERVFLENATGEFNFVYENDLEQLNISYLGVEPDCRVDIRQISKLNSLLECFYARVEEQIEYSNFKYVVEDGFLRLTK